MISVFFILHGCLPDDVTDAVGRDSGVDTSVVDSADTEVDDSAEDTQQDDDLIQGKWVSKGDDLAPLFVEYFDFVTVEARFRANGNYTVHSVAADGTTYDFSGTWTGDDSTSPGIIVLSQSSPSTATVQGIYEVKSGVLTYEVVQTQPDFGFTAPTPSSGFGSTAGDGLNPGDNVQVYRRP